MRAFRAVGIDPLFLASGRGSQVIDADGNRYIDYIGGWGPHILGHTHPAIQRAIREALKRGTRFGAATEAEIDLARLICDAIPSIEKVRLVNSGTEATMSAVRLARGFTGRSLLVKFIGCYHGHVDSLLVKAGSGVTTFALPESAGVPAEFTGLTLAVPFNNPAALREVFTAHGEKIAAVNSMMEIESMIMPSKNQMITMTLMTIQGSIPEPINTLSIALARPVMASVRE